MPWNDKFTEKARQGLEKFVEDSLLEESALYLQLVLWAKFETAVPTEI